LKEWLRGLPDPIFPYSVYDSCINLAKDDNVKPKDLLDLVTKLPLENQLITAKLCAFLRELSRPENSAVSKMNLKNLAIVFAPSLIRTNSDDPVVILQHSVKELNFVIKLIDLLPEELDCSSDVDPGTLKERNRVSSSSSVLPEKILSCSLSY